MNTLKETLKAVIKKRSNQIFFVIVLALIIFVSLTHKAEANWISTQAYVKTYVDRNEAIPDNIKKKAVQRMIDINKKASNKTITKEDRDERRYYNSVISKQDKQDIRQQIKASDREKRRIKRNAEK